MGKIAMAVILILILIGAYFAFKNRGKIPETNMPKEEQTAKTENYQTGNELTLQSPAFAHMGVIPARYTCDGEKINPPLKISGVSPQAKSLVLIMEDPDVPASIRADGMWDHWIKFDLPPALTEIQEGRDPGGISGINTSKNLGYAPPCPPDREHRYFFKLYSLDSLLNLSTGAAKSEIQAAMQGHILQETALVGLYERK